MKLTENGFHFSEGKAAGDACNRDGCLGIMEEYQDSDEYPCTCHCGNPPCTNCCSALANCSECDAIYREVF
jgi:hypothetical protein